MNKKLIFILFSLAITADTNQVTCKAPLFHKVALAFQDEDASFEINFPCCKHNYNDDMNNKIGLVDPNEENNIKITEEADKQIELLINNRDGFLVPEFKLFDDDFRRWGNDEDEMFHAHHILKILKKETEDFIKTLCPENPDQKKFMSCDKILNNEVDFDAPFIDHLEGFFAKISLLEDSVDTEIFDYKNSRRRLMNRTYECITEYMESCGCVMKDFLEVIFEKKLDQHDKRIKSFCDKIIVYFDVFTKYNSFWLSERIEYEKRFGKN